MDPLAVQVVKADGDVTADFEVVALSHGDAEHSGSAPFPRQNRQHFGRGCIQLRPKKFFSKMITFRNTFLPEAYDTL